MLLVMAATIHIHLTALLTTCQTTVQRCITVITAVLQVAQVVLVPVVLVPAAQALVVPVAQDLVVPVAQAQVMTQAQAQVVTVTKK